MSYFDFSSAFDSPDHVYMINVLDDLGFEDTDIIRQLYADTYLQVDTPVGVTAPIPKFRGTAQGDPLSPCLFNLVIGVLLRRLVKANVGVPIDRDTRVGALAFSDDLATVTTTFALQQAAIDELEAFEKESGMRLNIKKCMLTGFDFKNNEDLPPRELTYKGECLPSTCHLPGTSAFCHLGCRYALATRSGTSAQREKVIQDAKKLSNILQGHVYLPEQAYAVAKMVLHSSFLFSASTAAWDESSAPRVEWGRQSGPQPYRGDLHEHAAMVGDVRWALPPPVQGPSPPRPPGRRVQVSPSLRPRLPPRPGRNEPP